MKVFKYLVGIIASGAIVAYSANQINAGSSLGWVISCVIGALALAALSYLLLRHMKWASLGAEIIVSTIMILTVLVACLMVLSSIGLIILAPPGETNISTVIEYATSAAVFVLVILGIVVMMATETSYRAFNWTKKFWTAKVSLALMFLSVLTLIIYTLYSIGALFNIMPPSDTGLATVTWILYGLLIACYLPVQYGNYSSKRRQRRYRLEYARDEFDEKIPTSATLFRTAVILALLSAVGIVCFLKSVSFWLVAVLLIAALFMAAEFVDAIDRYRLYEAHLKKEKL